MGDTLAGRRTGRPTAGEAARLKMRIVDSALACLTEQGIGGMSIEAIARSAGVTKRTVYRHFPTKTDLVNDVLSRRIARMSFDALADDRAGRGGLDDIKAYCGTVVREMVRPDTVRFICLLHFEGSGDPAIGALLANWRAQLEKPLRDRLAAFVAAGERSLGADAAFVLLQDVMFGITERLRFGAEMSVATGGLSLDAFLEQRWAMFVRLLVPQAERA